MQVRVLCFFIVVLFISRPDVLLAQGNNLNSDTKVIIDGKDYIRHKVDKGEGLYRIAKNYNVSQEAILRANPGMSQLLTEGQFVNIPVSIVHQDDSKSIDSQKYIYHEVVAKETIYGISSQYGIATDELIRQNPGIAEQGLQIGTTLRIQHDKIVANALVKAQNESHKVESFDAVTFHTVDNGQTLYSIARNYGITFNELVNANVGINADNVPVGYVLMIPSKVQNNPAQDEQLLTHHVAKKETLFAISKRYSVDIDVIKKFNPTINFSNLAKGQTILIPTPKWFDNYQTVMAQSKEQIVEKEVSLLQNDCNNYNYQSSKDLIKIAVLLPFNVASGYSAIANDSTDVSDYESGNSTDVEPDFKAVSGKAKLMLEFYEGFLLGLDAYKRQGVNIQVSTYDTGFESADINKILQKPGIIDANMIVGPGNPSHLKVVSEFARKNKIKLINPFSAANGEIHNNPYLFQTTAIDSFFVDRICQNMIDRSKDGQLVLIRMAAGNNAYENNVANILRNKIALSKINQPALIEIAFSKGNIYAISERLVKDKVNYIFVPNDNEVFVNQVAISLSAIVERGTHQLEVYGIPEWLRFQSIDPESIHKLNGRIFSYYGVDYQSDAAKQFIMQYRTMFQTEPFAFTPYFQKPLTNAGYSRYGIWGYDISTFFVGAFVKYGPRFETCVSKMSNQGLIQSNFRFKRISNWGGFYNNGLLLLKFNRDFSIQREVIVEE